LPESLVGPTREFSRYLQREHYNESSAGAKAEPGDRYI
jgi:hypothetical protein